MADAQTADRGRRQFLCDRIALLDIDDFWTGQRYSGAQTVEADAPLETLPLFVRAGSIVPFGPDIQSSAEASGNSALLRRIYRGQDATSTLYEDEGDTYNYEDGAFSTIALHWDDAKKRLHIGRKQGTYTGMPMTKTFFSCWSLTNKGQA